MKIVKHRVNTVTELLQVPLEQGIELDVRPYCNSLVLAHDAFNDSLHPLVFFEDILKNYQARGMMVVNLKAEGIEDKCVQLMRQYEIKNWYFLDLSMPYFVLYAHGLRGKNLPKKHLSVRYSRYEPIELALAYQGLVDHVWVDCFSEVDTLNDEAYNRLKKASFQISLVSPELHGQNYSNLISKYRDLLGHKIDFVCTKYPELWV